MGCANESISLSEFPGSHGRVLDEEIIMRIIWSPQLFDESTGEVKVSIFSISELKNNEGSVTRKRFSDARSIQAQASEITKDIAGRKFVGVIHCRADGVRAIRHGEYGNEQCCCVLDKGAAVEKPAHATVGANPFLRLSKSKLYEVRKLLFDNFSPLFHSVNIEQLFK